MNKHNRALAVGSLMLRAELERSFAKAAMDRLAKATVGDRYKHRGRSDSLISREWRQTQRAMKRAEVFEASASGR